MPREPIPLIRQGGFLEAEKLFILSYEGKVSEKKYFEDFRKSEFFNDSGLIEVISLKRPSDKGSDPINVKKLLQKAKREYRFKKTDEFWLIIDRDDWETIHNHDFSSLVEDCNAEKNFFLAMSNPCFEIWLILHLKDINDFTDEEKQNIIENKKINASKNYIDKVLGDLLGRGYNKRPNPKIFLPKIKIAIERAKALNSDDEDYPKYIGSHIYKLAEKLIKEENPTA
ncbi:RloB domain-containing protein [Mariniphaga sediminis]|uniref:RloB domain-containing protein n=1 Tax=Mariniphaga sediminis TaxID=1628158 RepID=A0A399CZG0_9BACT|nr:RloB family protein [Mariniphaga sediminis]RIH64318.1 RloB domain-containing protein [Mariniphaga sediminis]